MGALSLHLSFGDLLLRLALSMLAGAMIGYNRDGHGRPAGLRTVMLVSIAATAAMIQANLLLSTDGRIATSFVKLDTMRLPLGVLSGMGFLGAGAIMRQGDLVRGVTTAATLWVATVIGLCFGGGQYILGILVTLLVLFILWALKRAERVMKRELRAELTITVDLAQEASLTREMEQALAIHGYQLERSRVVHAVREGYSERCCAIRWNGREEDGLPEPIFLRSWFERPGVRQVSWRPQGMAGGAPIT